MVDLCLCGEIILENKPRIIGIDNNPEAKNGLNTTLKYLFGINLIQKFWNSISEDLGEIDILLDDGGHLDHQQSTHYLKI